MIRGWALLALLCISSTGAAQSDNDALDIVERAFEATRANETIARRYVFRERIEQRRFNKKGAEKRRESKTYDVTLLDSSEYRRLVAINDEPLGEKAARKERNKLDRQIRKMRGETPKQREKRLARLKTEREESEKFLAEVTRAFDFRLTGEQEIDGVATHVVSAEPKPDYEPSRREAKVLAKLRGTLWIAKADHAWVKAEMELLDDITWALIFKLRKGANVRFTQRRVNDEVWLPDGWHVRLRAKAALFFKFNGELSGSYSDYRRFTTDSTALHGDEAR